MTNDLFSQSAEKFQKDNAPLAERLRPHKVEEIIGQDHLLGEDGALKKWISQDKIPSIILWGPPGSGKTTLARAIARSTHSHFMSLSAVLSGVKELRATVEAAKEQLQYHQRPSILFIDEIHRFNKAQQDALLPHLEDGTLTLIGATTENPSFEVIGPLLSRCRVFLLHSLDESALKSLVKKAEKTLGKKLSDVASQFLVKDAQGDARRMLNTLEIAAHLSQEGELIDLKEVSQATQHTPLTYDKNGEAHYNLISAFIKSMRASKPDAAIYYLARMYEAGEDPRFLARRMVIFAAEDIGITDPQALNLAVSAMQAYEFVGRAEGWIPLAEAATYLAQAPKSNASYQAYKNAKAEISQSGSLPVPLQLRNAPTKLMKDLDYGKDYRYAHSDPEGSKEMECLPDKIAGKKFFIPNID